MAITLLSAKNKNSVLSWVSSEPPSTLARIRPQFASNSRTGYLCSLHRRGSSGVLVHGSNDFFGSHSYCNNLVKHLVASPSPDSRTTWETLSFSLSARLDGTSALKHNPRGCDLILSD